MNNRDELFFLLGKWNKTALMYAVKNGHSTVAAYLLRIGVNPCAADTSGNTPIHYAAAYGWLHCLKMLMKAGADPNAANQWKASGLLVIRRGSAHSILECNQKHCFPALET